MGSQCSIHHGHICLLLSLLYNNEIKLSSNSSNVPPTFITLHILTGGKKQTDETGMFLSSSYQAHKTYISLTLLLFPSMTTQQECFMFTNLWVIFPSGLLTLSSCPSHGFYIIDISFSLLYSQLNPSKWLFNICKPRHLKQNMSLKSLPYLSLYFNAKLFKKLSVFTNSQ